MALIPTESLARPDFSSILLLAPPKRGKTASIATLHRVLRLRKLPTRIVFFDFDEDGAEPLLRLARDGYESVKDAIAKRNNIGPWLNDIILHRYNLKGLRIKDAVIPARRDNVGHEFINEFNAYVDSIDPTTGKWRDGKEVGALVIDSLTGLSDVYEDFVFGIRGKEIGEKGTSAIEWTEWRLLGEKLVEVYKAAKSLPCYTVLTAHVELRQEIIKGPTAREGKDDISTHQFFETPLAPGQLRDRITKDFGVVLYGAEGFMWRTKAGDKIKSAGTRGKDGLATEVEQDFANVLDI